MKYWLKILLFVFFPFWGNAQNKVIDSLRNYILTARQDTAKINPLLELGQKFWTIHPDTSLILFRQALMLSRQYMVISYEAKSLGYLGLVLVFNPKKRDSVLLCIQQAFTLARQNKLLEEEVGSFNVLARVYVDIWQKPDSGILFAHQGITLANKYKLLYPKMGLMWGLINGYRKLKRFDSSLQVCLHGISLSKEIKLPENEKQFLEFAKYIISQAPPDTARLLAEQAIDWGRKENGTKYEASFRKGLALSYKNDANYPEALKVFMTVLEMYEKVADKQGEAEVLDNIVRFIVNKVNTNSLFYFI